MMWLAEGGRTPHPRGADLSLGGMCTREGGREGGMEGGKAGVEPVRGGPEQKAQGSWWWPLLPPFHLSSDMAH